FLPHIFGITILHALVVLSFIFGIANALIFVPSNTIIQEKTSDEIRGKIYGVLNAMASLSSLLPVIVVGSLADLFGVGSVLVVLGIGMGLLGVFRLVARE
ncbi:MAG: MFS transporter, partial [Candidatus Levyibacteriota bacterium]